MMLVATIGNRVVGVSTMMLKSDNNTRYCSDSVTMVAPSLTRKKIGEKLFEARIKWARENDVEFITTCIVSKEGYNFLEAMSEKFTELEFDIREFGCSRISLRRPAP
jgi:GNAT superfamily N-acetyltransferase